jgi:hypothetical protein
VEQFRGYANHEACAPTLPSLGPGPIDLLLAVAGPFMISVPLLPRGGWLLRISAGAAGHGEDG